MGYEGFTDTKSSFYLDSKNQTNHANSTNKSGYVWLFDNLGWSDYTCVDYGCNESNTTSSNAYWTSTPYDGADSGL